MSRTPPNERPFPVEPPAAIPAPPRQETPRIRLPPLSHPRPCPPPVSAQQQGMQQ